MADVPKLDINLIKQLIKKWLILEHPGASRAPHRVQQTRENIIKGSKEAFHPRSIRAQFWIAEHRIT